MSIPLLSRPPIWTTRLLAALHTIRLNCVLPIVWLNLSDFKPKPRTTGHPPFSCVLDRALVLSPEQFILLLPETVTMTAPDRGLPKDVVPPGNQTGKYYIPISNVCETDRW